MLRRVSTYLSFLEYARGIGRGFHNFLSYDRRWLDAEGCGDCQGQAVRALADVLGSNLPDGYRALARELIDAVLPDTRRPAKPARSSLRDSGLGTSSQRGGARTSNRWNPWPGPRRSGWWNATRAPYGPDWQWFESRMTYANAVLPHALFVAAEHWPEEAFLEVAKASFAFLDRQTTVDGVFWPIGNEGWYPRGEEKALYDQQPVEAVTMAEAALAAFELHGDEEYLDAFGRAYGWFHGQNSLRAAAGRCIDPALVATACKPRA